MKKHVAFTIVRVVRVICKSLKLLCVSVCCEGVRVIRKPLILAVKCLCESAPLIPLYVRRPMAAVARKILGMVV
jgi:hypothetical protein